jgi:hypothetical protein
MSYAGGRHHAGLAVPRGARASAGSRSGGTRQQPSGMLIALILVLSSVTGLVAGVMTRQVASASAIPGSQQSTGSQHGCATQVSTSTSSATAALSSITPYKLVATMTPNRVKVCQPFQITVVARSSSGGSLPIAGVRCALVNPSEGPSDVGSALQAAATPQVTDTTGQVSWTATFGSEVKAGQYQIDVRGGDGQSYHYTWHATVTVVA